VSLYFITTLYYIIKLPKFIAILLNTIKLLFVSVAIFLTKLFSVVLKLRRLIYKFIIFKYKNNKIYKIRFKVKFFNFLNKRKKNVRDIVDYNYLNYPVIVSKFKIPKVKPFTLYSTFNFEDATAVNLEPFFDPLTYWARRQFWRNIYYRYYPENFFPLNLKPLIDRPGTKTSYCEKFRENEWKLVTHTNDFISVLDDFWEFDHGCAVYSWNIDKCPKILDVVKDHFYDDDERLWHFAEHLYELSSEDYFFENIPLIEPKEF